MKARITTVEFPVFNNYVVHVEVTSDLRKSIMKYPPTRAKVEELDENSDACTFDTHEGFSFMFIPYNVSVGTITHESWHVVHHMLGYHGVELDGEVVAYHLGYLVDKIFKFVRRKQR